jgi:hypothetical protein
MVPEHCPERHLKSRCGVDFFEGGTKNWVSRVGYAVILIIPKGEHGG